MSGKKDTMPPLKLVLKKWSESATSLKSVYFWRVHVRSNVREGLYRFKDLPITSTDVEIQMEAAALAEQLCEKYNDTVDPDAIYKAMKDLAVSMRRAMIQHFRKDAVDEAIKVESD